jgi:acyl-CoA synthetase (AMP-forming)/AMP-acid ligase II
MGIDDRLNFELSVGKTADHVDQLHSNTVGDLLSKQAKSMPDMTAILAEDGSELTYSELNERVNSLANAWLDRGIDRGDCVAIISENRPEFAEVIFAAAKIGVIVAGINWRQAREEMLHCLAIASPDAVVVSGDHEEKIDWITKDDELSPLIITLDEFEDESDYESLVAGGSASEPQSSSPVKAEDALAILYTSGTTGLPKGAVIGHRTFLFRAMAWHVTGDAGPDYVAWGPMFHIISTPLLFTTTLLGGTFYIVDGFKTELVLERVSQSDGGYFVFVPGVVDMILEYANEQGIEPDDYESLDRIGALADLVDPDKIQRLTELFDAEYANTFGSTEAGFPPLSRDTIPVGTRPAKDDLSKHEGQLCNVKLIDEHWTEVPTGEYGEMAVRGPTVFSGYIGNMEANESDFNDGWFRTGDMFVRNEDGSYDFIDRRKYLIKSGGENIYPAEIERVLLEHPDIREAIAVRVPDEEWGEVPKAYVSKDEMSDVTTDELITYMDGKIARYKLPHYIEYVDQDEFPRSTSGKIVRGDVEEWKITEAERVRSPDL